MSRNPIAELIPRSVGLLSKILTLLWPRCPQSLIKAQVTMHKQLLQEPLSTSNGFELPHSAAGQTDQRSRLTAELETRDSC